MDRSEFQKILKEINVELTDNQCDQFDKYYEILVEWNKVMNLTGITRTAPVAPAGGQTWSAPLAAETR